MSNVKAMITGVAGITLQAEEKRFIEEHQPWAFILFARNIGTAEEVIRLTQGLRKASQREDVFIFIDQEGGKVQRLRPPLAPDYPSAETLGNLYKLDSEKAQRATWIMSRLHAFDLIKIGIDANCLPLIDVPVKGAHNVIGSRAYGYDPEMVTLLGRQAADGLLSGGVLPVMKHIPGHGRAMNDTHLELARVDASLEELQSRDFIPFKALADLPSAMTAHVIYSAIDPILPATLSSKVIHEFIRKDIGFDGLLMSDDLSMKALSGSFSDITKDAFYAGCDVVLHCNGNMEEMIEIVSQTPFLQNKSLMRAQNARNALLKNDQSDEKSLRAEFVELLSLNA
ncbi:beta-N-acetylhexosaminidase [Bartonella tamiae]|uniref:beta-N-acetylhexosaminidase n=1 Tax=Bartonella tamiae Th239 TaxID=1094558 RepID=J0ZQ06_9HYPH|nr:beta-N-acetylhexosaminidase [Bartonella tamiae]EJF90693.1 hypothetical protein ME5_01094 [Bartonella tamiae Th239]EJF93930.1 hypothetical protein MEG_00788 [Bartonella tamiae Th307]